MGDPVRLSVEALATRIEAVFRRAGLGGAAAGAVARVLAAGERDGAKAHGIYRIAGCLRTVKAGKVAPDAVPSVVEDGTGIVRVDAAGGFSSPAFEAGLSLLVRRARALGVAALVINDCTHFFALWPEVEALAAHGLAGLAMCPSYATVAPAGGTQPLLGTNPIAFGWPRPGGVPYVFDFATSVAARGEIELRLRVGERLPEGWGIDAAGRPTTDPAAVLNGALLPFGGSKGSAIATMVELLAGTMIGDHTSAEALASLGTVALAPRHGELVLAFDPVRFAGGRSDPLHRAETLFDAILGQGARLPSQRRFEARARAEAEGILLSADDAADLDRMAALGLDAVD